MNKIKAIALGVFIFALLACEQPFKAGLGPVVDIRPPTVTLTSPSPGEYIYGTVTLNGSAEDDYKLESVLIRFLNYPNEENRDDAVLNSLRDYQPVDAKIEFNKGTWKFSIDTTKFDDGDFKIQLKATDSVKKWTETDPIVFLINNSAPAISVSSPYISRGMEDGQVGGNHLNYHVVGVPLPNSLTFDRQLDKGGFLTGTIYHEEDIYLGGEAEGRYPPQIRIWEISDTPVAGKSWEPGVLPPVSDVPWEGFVINDTLWALDLGSYMFIRELPEEAGRFYGFELRAQTKDGRTRFHYPRDLYAPRNWDGNGESVDDFIKENRYVLIFVRSPRELPTIDLYRLEDIFGPDSWVGEPSDPNGHYKELQNLPENYPYVDEEAVNKNGDFKLRIKTWHPEGISSAEVYWEKDDKSERGRFIWDLANEKPEGNPGWNDTHNAAADIQYSEWGYRDPNSEASDGFFQIKSFIYTYRQPSPGGRDDRNYIPAGAHAEVQGRSKIQQYTPTDIAVWESGKRSGGWPRGTGTTSGTWKDLDELDEGGYNIEVYTRSAYGTPLTVPFTCFIRMDRKGPEIVISAIDGVSNLNPEGVTEVNGVISPRLRISDSRSADSGLRTVGGDYFKVYEQRFMVIPAASKGAFDLLNKDNWWPDPAKDSALTGITVSKDGPVLDNSFRFKTSNIYFGPDYPDKPQLAALGLSVDSYQGRDINIEESDKLPDGDYYLYIFARDNAFNTGCTTLPIKVNHLSDFPEFDFSVGSINPAVTDPSVSADNTPTGFRQGNSVRNYLSSGSSIRLRLRDDDSLDLGLRDGDDSSVKITIARSVSDAVSGTITALSEVSLPDTSVKEIFAPQSAGTVGGRSVLRERQGDIKQEALVQALGGDGKSLPDGIYQIGISAGDFAPAKLLTETNDATAARARKTMKFWVAVDNTPPVIGTTIEPASGTYIGSGVATIKGTVSDQNGPITLELLSVINEDHREVPVPAGLINRTNEMVRTGNTSLWEYNFTASIELPDNIIEGNFIFTLRFTDRFGKQNTITPRYMIDEKPPEVKPLTPIKTFSREIDATKYPGVGQGKEILTNGIVSFAFTATDNQKVKEARWWLVPAGDVNKPANFDALINDTDPVDVTLNMDDNKKGGRLTDKFSGYIWYINTVPEPIGLVAGLADGPYTLYAAAKDEAGTPSVVTKLQDIYVLQDEDRPWFGAVTNITPNLAGQGVIGRSGAVVRGSIYEDDGFFDNSNNVLANSVRIFMSSNENAGSIKDHADFNADPIPNTVLTTYGYAEGTIPASSITRAGGSNNINLNIDLREISQFTSFLEGDGIKHYVIEARDSYHGKYINESGGTAINGDTALTSRIRREYFSFLYDDKDPVIKVISPEPGATFGKDSNSTGSTAPFFLEASITDANLDTLSPSGNYYFSWKRSGTSDDYNIFDLGIKGDEQTSTKEPDVHIVSNNVTNSERTITFTISAEKFTETIGYVPWETGNYELSLQVKDKSNKTHIASLNFLKDTLPPSVTFNTINGLQLPSPLISNVATPWWNVATDLPGYRAKRTALEAMPIKLTVIQHEENTGVIIKGNFVDTHSDVANTARYAIDNKTEWYPVTLVGTGKNVGWTIDIPASRVPDGVHSISISVADIGGNRTESDTTYYGFIVVSKRPTIKITSAPPPVMGDRKTTGASVNDADTVFTVSGNAESASLSDVKLKISFTDAVGVPAWNGTLSELVPDLFSTLTYLTEPYLEMCNWSYNIPRKALYDAGGLTGTDFRGGNYELSAISVDKSGAESDEALLPFIIDVKKPIFEFTTPRNTNSTDTTAPGTTRPASYWVDRSDQNVIMSSEPKLQVSISDNNDLKEAQYQIRRFNYTTNAWGTYYNGTGWVTAETWVPIASVTGANFAWSLDIKDLPDGYYYVRLRAADSSVITGTTPINNITWANTGAGNPESSVYGYFFLSRTAPQLANVDTDKIQFSSKVVPNNRLPFKVNATDLTWFKNLKVVVTSKTSTPYNGLITYPDPNYLYSGGATNTTGAWQPEVSIEFPTSLKDGMYDITFTLTNIAGRENSITRTITLDNTAPTGTVDTPQTMNVGSTYRDANPYPWNNPATDPATRVNAGPGTTIYGGEDEAILSGITDDAGENGSASGVAEIWYHLGYVGTALNNTPTGPLVFPTEANIISAQAGITGLTLDDDGRDLGGTANNALFDTAARSLTTAWFKYDPAAEYHRPHGVSSVGSDLINWKLVIERTATTEIANYAKAGFALKTGATATRYNNPNGQWMVKQINPAGLPQAVNKDGLYSMPLWIRVADTVGNVRYFCKDIWLYPNGDYPSNAFRSPATPQDLEAPKGGQFSIQGDASDNINVKKVIYRVKADDVSSDNTAPTYNSNWATVGSADANIVYLTGVDQIPSEEFTSAIPDYAKFTPNSNPFGTGTGKLSTNGWYYATLEAGAAPTMPWSIIINGQNEITDTVMTEEASAKRWFYHPADSQVKYTRLYIEVFVFDSDTDNEWNKISLGSDNDPASPKPGTLVVYMTSSAPNIGNLKISKKDGSFDSKSGNAFNDDDFSEYRSTFGQNDRLRSRRFAVRMDLDGSTRPLTTISARHYEKGTIAPEWTNVWAGGTIIAAANTGIQLTGVVEKITMTYAFTSLITSNADNYAALRDVNWAVTGGTYVLEVRIEDDNDPVKGTASTRFEIGIDNFAPVADPAAITNTKVAGTNVDFLGRAFDYSLVADGTPTPNYRGIESVYAWFTQDNTGTGNYINMDTGKVKGSVDTDSRPAWKGRTATVTYGTGSEANNPSVITVSSSPAPTPDVSYPTEPGYFKELSAEIGGVLTNRVTWQMNKNDSADVYWSFIADTTEMPDGWMYLNYLVIDNAGNATLYQQHMMVRNNYPEITGVTLFTDNRGEGAAFTQGGYNDPNSSSYYPVNNGTGTNDNKAVGYLNSGFISKNQAIGFEVETVKGNGNLNYRMQYVQRKSVALTAAIVKSMKAGTYDNANLYTIKAKGDLDNAGWNLLGVKEADPGPGNHFVCSPDLPDATIDDLILTGTEVWYYTMPGPTTGTDMLVKTDTETGNTANAEKLRFFKGPVVDGGGDYFNVGTITDRIPEMLGSRPEETEYDDPEETAFFIIKVWDSVSQVNKGDIPPAEVTQYSGEKHQLYDVVVIGMNVYLSDHMNPTIRIYDLNPYTELTVMGSNSNPTMQGRTMENAAYPTAMGANILRGGLFNVNTNQAPIRSGYIEPRNSSTALKPSIKDAYSGTYEARNANGYVAEPGNGFTADAVRTDAAYDRVSGRIILRGQAWDDQLIDEIRVRVDTTRPEVTNEEDGFTTILKLQAPVGDGTTNVIRSYNNALAWAVEEMHWKTGHTVEWAYILDTEQYNLGTAYITVIVKDKNADLFNGDPEADDATDTNGTLKNATPITIAMESQARDRFHNQIPVTITPYVVGFARADQYATNRSVQGWYSFFQGETGIRLLGYNLGGTAPTMAIKHGSAATDSTPITVSTVGTASTFAPRRYTFSMPAGAQSGRIEVTTGATAAYNHDSVHASRSWNRESNASVSGSGLWLNKPHAHIWRTTESATAPITYFGQIADTIGMSIPSMALEYTGTNSGRLTGVWASYGEDRSFYARNNNAARAGNFGISNNGEPLMAHDVSFYNGGTANGSLVASGEVDGNPQLRLYDGTDFGTVRTIGPDEMGRPTQRWMNSRVSRADGRSYTTSYDSYSGGLFFAQYVATQVLVNIDGGNKNTDTATIVTNIPTTTIGNAAGNSIARSAIAGEYSAVDYDNYGPIVAYYDQSNDTLRIAYAQAAGNAITTGTTWVRQNVIPSGHDLYRGSGRHVSIKVDSSYNVHLAFYNSSKDAIVYAFASARTSNTAILSFTNANIYIVDNVVKGGTRTDISVDSNGNPWIVYGDTSRMGNYDGARIAYRSSGNAGISFGTNAWEAVTMPANYIVNNDRLNIEVWPPTVRGGTLGNAPAGGWNAAIGYASDRYRIGYFYYPGYKGYNEK